MDFLTTLITCVLSISIGFSWIIVYDGDHRNKKLMMVVGLLLVFITNFLLGYHIIYSIDTSWQVGYEQGVKDAREQILNKPNTIKPDTLKQRI